MNDSYMIGQMNTFMHRLSEQMSGWLGKRLPKLTDEWWRDFPVAAGQCGCKGHYRVKRS